MRLYEYEAKKLFSKFGIPISSGEVVETAEQARGFAEKLGKPVVLKAQILSGGRGKAGGVKFASSPQEAKKKADELLSTKIKGFPVNRILVDEKLNIEREFYLGITLDRVNYKIVVLVCSEGGVEIEEVAKRSPDKIKRISVDVDQSFYPFMGNSLAGFMGAKGDDLKNVGKIAGAILDALTEKEKQDAQKKDAQDAKKDPSNAPANKKE